MQMLCNYGLEIIEGKYDGTVYRFSPGEKKVISDETKTYMIGNTSEEVFNRASFIVNHLIHKLAHKGLCIIDSEMSEDELKEVKIQGLMQYRNYCVKHLLNFETLNRECEENKKGRQLPTDVVKKAAIMKKKADAELDKLRASDIETINEAMAGITESERAAVEIEKDITEESSIDEPKRRGRPKKEE